MRTEKPSRIGELGPALARSLMWLFAFKSRNGSERSNAPMS